MGEAPTIPASVEGITPGWLTEVLCRKHDSGLLAEYHAGLYEGGVTNYSLEQLNQDYRSHFAGIIASGAILGATLPDGNDRGKAMLEATFTRVIAAIDDLDALTLLPPL